MDRDEIKKVVTDIFCDVFDRSDIVLTDETTANDINGWDSLTHITLINEIESTFGFKFGMKEVLGMKNVGEMLTIIENNT